VWSKSCCTDQDSQYWLYKMWWLGHYARYGLVIYVSRQHIFFSLSRIGQSLSLICYLLNRDSWTNRQTLVSFTIAVRSYIKTKKSLRFAFCYTSILTRLAFGLQGKLYAWVEERYFGGFTLVIHLSIKHQLSFVRILQVVFHSIRCLVLLGFLWSQ